MRREWWVIREFGFRYWVAYVLVRLAHSVKDTTFHQVVKIPDGAHVMIYADAWGSGVGSTVGVQWEHDEAKPGRPVLREFDDIDAALDWAHGDEEAA
ncbi:hypothetical protein [Nocardia sp. NPDC049707]|uniref:hypothetical protein n=1 Tax=Nocardia sp. NPDC049707 TaxID=3154735 RepID=UPI00341A4B66